MMYLNKFKKVLILSVTLSIVVSYNACEAPFQAIDTLESTSSELDPPSGQPEMGNEELGYPGIKLYATNCSQCHGPLETSKKRGAKADDIQKAITTRSAMSFLSKLTTTEINQIAYVLNNDVETRAPADDTKPTQFKVLVKNRHMLKEQFKEFFVVDTGGDTTDANITTIIENLIGVKSEAFGGHCSRYDAGCMKTNCGAAGDGACVGELAGHISASQTPVLSAISMGLLARTCEEILAIDKAVNTVLTKSGLSVSTAIDSTSITKLINYFNRGDTVSTDIVSKLIEQNAISKQKGYSTTDQWRFIILPICTSTGSLLL